MDLAGSHWMDLAGGRYEVILWKSNPFCFHRQVPVVGLVNCCCFNPAAHCNHYR